MKSLIPSVILLSLTLSFCAKYKVYKNLEEAISEADKVEVLDLSGQKINSFPKELLKLPRLRRLSLSFNQIKEIPESIVQMKSLKVLGLVDNQITVLPDNISQLKGLRVLYLMKNPLSGGEKRRIKKALPDCRVYFKASE
ncbi:MAG: leucine-rich repeat domain-containing protein [Spirochaetota bacterium]|nr:leucine-rich repeat domain-containing protein [Spirochaetota bacterium]